MEVAPIRDSSLKVDAGTKRPSTQNVLLQNVLPHNVLPHNVFLYKTSFLQSVLLYKTSSSTK